MQIVVLLSIIMPVLCYLNVNRPKDCFINLLKFRAFRKDTSGRHTKNDVKVVF